MLIRTEGRSNPLTEISGIAAFWFFWGAIFGVCFLATAQRVIHAIDPAVDAEGNDALPTEKGPPPSSLPPRSPAPAGTNPSQP